MKNKFVHLRVHTVYSLSESTLRISDLAKLAQDDYQPAMAITDSQNLFGAYEFSKIMSESGIQPIIGSSVFIKDEYGEGEVVLLAQNESGYKNLSKLLSDAWIKSDGSDKPLIDVNELIHSSEGLILLTGGVKDGFIPCLAVISPKLAQDRLRLLSKQMEGRIYLELQRHKLKLESDIEEKLIEFANNLDLPLIATNDCHFDNKEMHVPQKILTCIATNQRLASMSSYYQTEHHRFKTAKEMFDLFHDIPEAVLNSLTVAKRCSFMIQDRQPILPEFYNLEGRSPGQVLCSDAEEGLKKRLGALKIAGNLDLIEDKYFERLRYELSIIMKMGFTGYFLIVSDFINWAKDNNIAVGPGRGSGAGSLVAWALRITDLDPIKWGLLFERFLNPERVSMPDFDIDFCQDRRDEVIQYVQQRYGKDKVAQIITFGKLQARAAIRDVGRVLDMPYSQVDKIAKMIPNNPAAPTTIAQALENQDELAKLCEEDESAKFLLQTAMKLEGLYRHASTHAAGLVIGDRSLPELVPIYRDPRSEIPVTQFNMKYVEKVGLVKFDFLGLKTLTVIEKAVELIEQSGGSINLENLPLDDKTTYEMLAEGDTVGVFQLESSGMRDVLRGLKPDRFEDIIAVVALYRPGPMDNIPAYINRKHGRESVIYMHERLESILSETYGIMIYQEQVQQAARDLAGYTLGSADILRRAMGKKIQSEMDSQRAKFVEGAIKNNIDNELASQIFDQISAFAGYGFNKSHAAAYALIAYQTAYLKANYPVQFMAALMALDSGNVDKLSIFKQDCMRKKIEIMPPDINFSQATFSVEKSGTSCLAVRYGLGAIKNVGEEAMRTLCKARDSLGKFNSIEEFAHHLPQEVSNKRQLESLIQAGVFDNLHSNRNQLWSSIDTILGTSNLVRKENNSQQVSLFAGSDIEPEYSAIRFIDCPEWSQPEKIAREFEVLGLYLSAHPLDQYEYQLKKMNIKPSNSLHELNGKGTGQRITMVGQLTSVQERISQKGNRFAFLQFTDKTGGFEVTCFSDLLISNRDSLQPGNILIIYLEAKIENGLVRLLAQRIMPLEDKIASAHSGLGIWVENADCLEDIKLILSEDGEGKAPVVINIIDTASQIKMILPNFFQLSGNCRKKLKSVPGIIKIEDILENA